ncbi:MAG: TIM barrel protein, partial [Actinomycetota bacterium]|nr:TIM barrel protein [Actinomycetota bacterium]
MFNIGVSISPEKSDFGPILFSGNLDKGLEAAKNLGYDGVELSLLDSDKIDRAALENKLKKLNLKVFAIATGQTYYTDGFSLFSSSEDKRDMAVKRITSHINLASILGCMVIIGGVRGKINEKEDKKAEQIEKGKAALVKCIKHAEKMGVILLLEPI